MVETAIRMTCFNCNIKLKVPSKYAGRQSHCPKCRASILVPSTDETDYLPAGSEDGYDLDQDNQPELLPPLPRYRSPQPLGPSQAASASSKPHSRDGKEPRIYWWVAHWAKNLIWSSLLLSLGAVLYVIRAWISEHHVLELRRDFTFGEDRMLAEAVYRGACERFMAELGGIGLSNLLLLVVAGCALILVDIGRTHRRHVLAVEKAETD